jgi:dihydrolipoamide dehydrogenase
MEISRADATTETVEADEILLATGSSIQRPALFPDHPAILDSTSIFQLSYLPAHFVVIGGGYIGCEMACAFHGLGSRVTLIEKMDRLLPMQPEFEAAGSLLRRSFEKRGLTVWTGTVIERVQPVDEKRVQLVCSNGETLDANAVLVAIGRAPNVQRLAIEKAGLALTDGRLTVNAQMQTSVPHIYAIGDLVSPLPLAHTASWEASVAVTAMAGKKETMNYADVPRCIYTWPEAAAVGLSEEQSRQAGLTPRIDRYHFAGNSKALIEGEPEGFWVSISDAATQRLLGGLIVGPHATELIHLVAMGMKAGFSGQEVSNTIFAHPSLAESFRDVALRSLSTNKTQTKS